MFGPSEDDLAIRVPAQVGLFLLTRSNSKVDHSSL